MKKIASQAGFTLIEAVIAILALSIGILGILMIQLTVVKGNNMANIISKSTNAACNTIEELIATDFNDSALSKGEHNATAASPIQSIRWFVFDWQSDGIDNDHDGKTDEFDERGIKNIQLTVRYREKDQTGNYTIRFFKTKIF